MQSTVRQAINNLMPGNQLFGVGDLIARAEGIGVRNPDLVRYVDFNRVGNGDGLARDTAFNNIITGINWLNMYDEKGATLLIMPGFSIENAANIPALTASDCLIAGIDLPEQTVIFGSGARGSITAATDDLLKILGGNNHILGLGLYVHADTKACILFDDTGGGYAGSFNRIESCYFSPQAQDGMGYGIKYLGGNANQIVNNIFYGAKEAAIHMGSQVGNPVRNIIKGNQFVGTNIGVNIDAANYNTDISYNLFSLGTQSGENMTNGVVATANMVAGLTLIYKNQFTQSAVNDVLDNSVGGSVLKFANDNAV